MPSIEYGALLETTSRHGFVSGKSEIDKWFYKHAWRDHARGKHVVTCANFDDKPDNVIGFYVLSSVVEDVKSLPSVPFFAFSTERYFPCVQLTYMAMRSDCQKLGYGSVVLGEVVRTFASIGQMIGLPAMILTPIDTDAARFYGRWGFEPYDRNTKMFLPLRSAIEAIAAAEAQIQSEDQV